MTFCSQEPVAKSTTAADPSQEILKLYYPKQLLSELATYQGLALLVRSNALARLLSFCRVIFSEL